MTNAKSVAAAQQLGDIFARLQWHRRGIYVSAGSEPAEVAILDKKEERRTPVQQELLPLGSLSPVARRSMLPD